MARKVLSPALLASRINAGDRIALAQGITLIESTHPKQRAASSELLALLESKSTSFRIGVTGLPGSGKSTLIETLGLRLIDAGERVAVLTVDPSSPLSGGSLLGDKTRMNRLSSNPAAFVRPSPAGGDLGGVHRQTFETIRLCEAAGFSIILIETVGIGQSEGSVRAVADLLLLLLITGAGDELQASKRGVLELADLVLVTKADGENRKAAAQEAASLSRSLLELTGLSVATSQPEAIPFSVHNEDLVGGTLEKIQTRRRELMEPQVREDRRRGQLLSWFQRRLREEVVEKVLGHPHFQQALELAQSKVVMNKLRPESAVTKLTSLLQITNAVEREI